MKTRKKIWFFCTSEPNELDGKNIKLRRHGQLMVYLRKKGFEVLLITSNFSHYTKKIRNLDTKKIKITNNFSILSLKTLSYKKNISIRRYISYLLLGYELKKTIKKLDRPDAIVLSLPPIDTSVPLVRYAIRNNVPIISDFRDMWPDIINISLRGFFRFCFTPFFYLMKSNLIFIKNNSDVVISVSKGMLRWIKSRSLIHQPSKYIYISHNIKKISIKKINKKIKIFYAGVINSANDMRKFLNYFLLLDKNISNQFEIFIAGYGDEYQYLSDNIKNENIFFLGWVGASHIKKYSRLCNYGLVTYTNRKDFFNNVPNKLSEYLGYGLPVISTLGGESYDIMKKANCVIKCDLKNFNSFKQMLIKIVHNPSYKKQQINARNLFEKYFDSKKNLNQYYNVINEVIKK